MVAGAIASVVGFGIGSILTPLLSLTIGVKLAVAAVSVPHALATTIRFWLVRHQVDRRVLLSFGLTSAAGGLLGATLQAFAANPILTTLFGTLLVFAGGSALTGFDRRLRFGRRGAWLGGALSGLLGGLVGNQGGIRAAAMLGFEVRKEAFVATSTAIGLLVDAARIPVYLVTQGSALASVTPLIAIGCAGALVGTALGLRLLRRVPETLFRRIVGTLILALGLFTLGRLASGSA